MNITYRVVNRYSYDSYIVPAFDGLLTCESTPSIDAATLNMGESRQVEHMKKRIQTHISWLVAACLFTIMAPLGHSQTVESLTLTTQADVDAATNVTAVTNNLLIETDGTLGDPIVNLNGLENLQSVGGTLIITNNDALEDTLGLLNLTDVENLSIQYNNALTNIDGLSNLALVENELLIAFNSSLERFCGLYMLFEVQGVDWNYVVDDGTTLYGIEFDGGIRERVGAPCVFEEPEEEKPIDPEMWIQSLFEDGVLRKWQARSLLYSLRGNCPRYLLWKVSLLVRWRILTDELAQPLVDAANSIEVKSKINRSSRYKAKYKSKKSRRYSRN